MHKKTLYLFFIITVSIVGFCNSALYADELTIYDGVAYVLMPNEHVLPGVYRLNDYDGSPCAAHAATPLFGLGDMPGKVSGLSANQQGDVFLLAGPLEGDWEDAPVGWLPLGMRFADDSPIYLKVMLPNDSGVTNYRRSDSGDGNTRATVRHWSSSSSSGSYWKLNHAIDGITYDYAVMFRGPNEVKYLNGVSGIEGTPIWNGVFSSTTGLAHPSDERKVILPSHWAGVAYYAYGTPNNTEFPGEPLDGRIGNNGNMRPLKIWTDTNPGHQHRSGSDNTLFSCIVKRIYKHREKTLDLYSARDDGAASVIPTLESAGMLASLDVNVSEAYGKYCGDNCIPGGTIGSSDIMTQLSTVRVITSTRGNRYGFNPQGIRQGPYGSEQKPEINASLRIVLSGSTSAEPYDLASGDDDEFFSSYITNAGYLEYNNILPSQIQSLGVSSDYDNNIDHIYASEADMMVVQDSWWGLGGLAYTYCEETGHVEKDDYRIEMDDDKRTAELLGEIEGKVDDIGIDGQGYFYTLKTEFFPSVEEMRNEEVSITNPESSDLFDSISGWKRMPSVGDEYDEASLIDIAEGQQQPGDFKIVRLAQEIRKVVYRRPEATGALGNREYRESVHAGYDIWTRRLELTNSGNLGWVESAWRQPPQGERISEIPAELAVVNLAGIPEVRRPSDGTNLEVILVDVVNDKPIETYSSAYSVAENQEVTFKIQGYKPYVDGSFRNLVSRGSITNRDTAPETISNIMINNMPASDGSFDHDENNDGVTSGLPSHMFEAGSSYQTTFEWNITRVAGDKAVDSSDEIDDGLGKGYKFVSSNSMGHYTYVFRPGEYLIQGTINYNYLDFEDSGLTGESRPSNVPVRSTSKTTTEFLLKVHSEHLALNRSPSYITDVKINPEIVQIQGGRIDLGVTSPDGVSPLYYDLGGTTLSEASQIDFEAGEYYAGVASVSDEQFEGISFSFKAQFVRDNPDPVEEGAVFTDHHFETFDGIGVWDYAAYTELFNEIKGNIQGLPFEIPDVGPMEAHGNVYNYIDNNALGVLSRVDTSVYNPGRPLSHDQVLAEAGTQVSAQAGTQVFGEPSINDLRMIQWALYLTPTSPTEEYPNIVSGQYERGTLIGHGNLADAKSDNLLWIDEIGDRKYEMKVRVKPEDLEQINTPKDPFVYYLHLELIYPRVTWANNDLDDDDTDHVRFSSIVPFYCNTNNFTPFHLISNISLDPPANNIYINQSYQTPTGEDLFVDGISKFAVRARDARVPQGPFYEGSDGGDTVTIQTTGDRVDDVNISFGVYDDNPHAVFGSFEGHPISELADFGAVYQLPTSFNRNDRAFQSPYETYTDETLIEGEDTPTYFKDEWSRGASYSVDISAFGAGSDLDWNGHYRNWVGELYTHAVGSVYDGLGTDSTNLVHVFYSEESAADMGIDLNTAGVDWIRVASSVVRVERYDNDPPDIIVELISQTDNRHWTFILEEDIYDNKGAIGVPQTVDEFSPSRLEVVARNLQTGTDILGSPFENDDIAPTGYNPISGEIVGNKRVSVTSSFPGEDNVIPIFRRASRLLVNIHIFDNVGNIELASASITISDSHEGVLLHESIPLIPSHDQNGVLRPEFSSTITGFRMSNPVRPIDVSWFSDINPRATHAVDMPMRVIENENQVTVEVYAEDQQGNARLIEIPVRIVPSTFETRVLESHEERR